MIGIWGMTVITLWSQDVSFAAASPCPAKRINAPRTLNLTKDLSTPTALRFAILAYLNQGGSYSGLLPLTQDDDAGSVIATDLNGDGTDEIVFSTSLFNDAWGRASWISIYRCQDGQYTSTDFELEAGYIYRITVVRIIDLMRTGYPQVVFQYQRITSACSQGVIIIKWDGRSFVSAGELPYVYCPATIRVLDYDLDGRKEIYLRGRTDGNPESGVGRGVVEVYRWSETSFQRIAQEYLPSPYRIHILQDAQIAVDHNSIAHAIELYEQAATRAYLLNEPSVYEKMNGQDYAGQYQTAFANFRLVTLWTSLGKLHQAQNVIERMKLKYLPAGPGYELVDLAMIFQQNASGNNDLASVCKAVTSQINTKYPNLAGYGYIGNWGTANVTYSNEDLCPFK